LLTIFLNFIMINLYYLELLIDPVKVKQFGSQ
jgi:hypothetical protein